MRLPLLADPFSVVFVLSAAISFASSLWCIHMALFIGWRSQFSALQGGTDGVLAADAVGESLQIVLMTSERVTRWFSTALGSTALSTTLLAFAHLPWVSLVLLAVFAFTLYDAVTFRRVINVIATRPTPPPPPNRANFPRPRLHPPN